MKNLYYNFILLLINKPYLHLVISIGVIFIWRITFIQVVYAETGEEFVLDMQSHYDKVIIDINNLIQENPDPLDIFRYVSAVIDPNIVAKTEEDVKDKNSEFNLYIETFSRIRPFLLPIPKNETFARDLYKAAAYTYNTFMVMNAFERPSPHEPSLYQANPELLRVTFDETFKKISQNTYFNELQRRQALVKDSLETLRRIERY